MAGRNFKEGTHVPISLKKYHPDSRFRELQVEMKRRGRPPGFEIAQRYDDPRTPFEALRFLLKLDRKEWCKINDCSLATLSAIENGGRNGVVANVSLAKRMQDEARQRGIAITLDELYQNVIPWEVMTKEENKEGEVNKENEE